MSWLTASSSQNVPVSHRTSRHGGRDRDDIWGLVDDFFKNLDFPTSPFGPSRSLAERWQPPINFSDADKMYVVEAELPGVKKEDIRVDIQDGVLTIKGSKKSFTEDKKDQYYRMERSHGHFQRSVRLPIDADDARVSAKLDNGILQIEIQKSEEASVERKTVTVQ